MVNFCVVSLFTNVTVDETLQLIQQRFISKEFHKHLVELVRLCLTTTYFILKGIFC